MVVTPNQCVAIRKMKMHQKAMQQADELEKKIDDYLLACYDGEDSIIIPIYQEMGTLVQDFLFKKYVDHGWVNMEFKSNYNFNPSFEVGNASPSEIILTARLGQKV